MADENAAWSMAGAYALAEYVEQYEEDCGIEIEFDRVALRCEYSEHESLQGMGAVLLHRRPADGWLSSARITKIMRRRLSAITSKTDGQLIEFDGGIIVSEF